MFKYNFIFLSCFCHFFSFFHSQCDLYKHDTYRYWLLKSLPCRHPSPRLKLDWNLYIQQHNNITTIYKIRVVVFYKKWQHFTWTFFVLASIATFQNLCVSRLSFTLLTTVHCALSLLSFQVLLSSTGISTIYCCLPFAPFTIN